MALSVVSITPGSGAGIAVDNIDDKNYQYFKLMIGADGVASPVTGANPLPVASAQSGAWTITDITSSIVPGVGATNLGKAEDAQHTSGDVGVMALCVRNDSDTSLAGTTGDYCPPQVDASGYLKVNVKAGALSGPSIQDKTAFTRGTTTANPIAGIYNTSLDSLTDGNGGALAITVKRSLHTTMMTPLGDSMVDDTLDALNCKIVGGSIAGIVDDAAVTVTTTEVLMVGFMADETATDSVNEGDGGMARMTLDRKVIVAPHAHTQGGATGSTVVSAASNNATSLKASAGQVYSITGSNVNAAMRYLKLYDKASAPTPASDNALLRWVLPLPGNAAGAGATHSFPTGLEFTSGIAWALVTGASATDNTSVSASEHVISIAYK